MEEDQEFSFEHGKFEMYIKRLREDVELAIEYVAHGRCPNWT